MPDLTAIDKILADLPKIQALAASPNAQNPMLLALLQQAQALTEIGTWAQNAQALLGAERAAPTQAPAEMPPTPLPVTNGRRA